MDDERSILEMLGVDLHYLTQVVKANPSLRGVIIGYLAERKLWDFFSGDPRITQIRKDDDHDRENKGDLVVTYQQEEIRFEIKSLQTNSIKMFDPSSGKWIPKIIKQQLPVDPGRKRKKNKWIQSELFQENWLKGSLTRANARLLRQNTVFCDILMPIKISSWSPLNSLNLRGFSRSLKKYEKPAEFMYFLKL